MHRAFLRVTVGGSNGRLTTLATLDQATIRQSPLGRGPGTGLAVLSLGRHPDVKWINLVPSQV